MTLQSVFGVNETTLFMFTGYGGADLGKNQNFPSGPNTKLPALTQTVDDVFREYFRYFLHYGNGNPPLKMLRIATGFDFSNEDTYNDWKANPNAYYAIFDSMVKWATAANVQLVPVIMHCSQNTSTVKPANRDYVFNPTRTAHLIEFSRALMTKYESESCIVMWDLLNEPCPAAGGAGSYSAWVNSLVSQVRSATAKPLTIGHDLEFVMSQSEFMQIHQNLDVFSHHIYNTDESPGNLDYLGSWSKAVGKPFFLGELGWNARSPEGYHPFYTTGWLSRNNGPACAMGLYDSGRGAYSDYPYLGVLPDYGILPPPPPPPPLPPVPVDLTQILADIADLKIRLAAMETIVTINGESIISLAAQIATLQAKVTAHTHPLTVPGNTLTIPAKALRTGVS